VYCPNPLDFKAVGDMAQHFRATFLATTPTFLAGYMRKCSPEQFASLRYVIAGAEKLRPRVAETFHEKFGIEPLEGYGCTELSPIVAVNVPDLARGRVRQRGRKPGTVGHPLPGVAVRIVDPETLAPRLTPDTAGLLLVKGANVMQGYLKDPERTQAAIRDGWYITGDLASVDADGFLTIKDRLSRFSKIGGEMVPHIRVEEEIQTLLQAVDEPRCVVTSVPDEHKGESLVVLYVGDLDLERLWGQLAASQLPKLWIPKKDAFHRIDQIPLLGSGKLDLTRIKAMALQSVRQSGAQS
jgi:acyl-[acyl-carrier-protein]-phospholipid O-acyltransferase/long-chain-fatty-acid--[acyl-carrier-protein] ligase